MHNRIKDAFDVIQADEQIKDNTKAYLERATGHYGSPKKLRRRKYTLAAVLGLCLFLTGGGFFSYFTPVALVSIDINPSLELGINRYDRVISVTGYDSDGVTIAETAEVKHQKYLAAVEDVLDSVAAAGYLNAESLVELTVAGSEEDNCAKILTELQGSTYCQQQEAVCYSGDQETAEEAHAAGLSCGKYRAYLELQALDPDVSIADVQNLTMRQIHDLIDDCNEESEDSDSQQTNENGQHQGEHSAGHAAGVSNGAGNSNGNASDKAKGNGYRHNSEAE